MKDTEYILINVRGAKSFKGKLRWNMKVPAKVAQPLFQVLAYLSEETKKFKSKKSA